MSEFRDIAFEKNRDNFGHFKLQTITNFQIWLKELPENSEAFFDECAHMGGPLSHLNGFVCKRHGWTYTDTGENINQDSPSLRRVEIVQEDEKQIVFRLRTRVLPGTKVLDNGLKVSVLSHACLLFEYGSKKILFDPWLKGTAFYGSWSLEPKPDIEPKHLKVDAIVITHPHPDHFHLETLDSLDKSTPIYFPGFPSKIIEKGLERIGWQNIFPIAWEYEFKIGKYLFLQFLQPRSLWEDSATLLRVKKEETMFTWLNLVDAGSVIDEYLIPDLDLLSSAFDQGASGYPLTWPQISQRNQVGILQEQKNQKLLNLPTKSNQLNAKHFLPFAGHWKLGLEQHKKYAELVPHTSFEELEASFTQVAPNTKFLGLMPGMAYDFFSQEISRLEILSNDQLIGPDEEKINFPSEVTDSDVNNFNAFMKELVEFSRVYDSESVEFCVEVEAIGFREVYIFSGDKANKIFIDVKIPEHIFILLANRVANWDHIAIGYWGIWSRTPNRYPANFMRLLQVGSPDRYESQINISDMALNQLLEKSIAELLERNSGELTQLFTKVGLPCGACSLTNTETLGQALKIHRVDLSSKPWFLRELLAAWSFKASNQ